MPIEDRSSLQLSPSMILFTLSSSPLSPSLLLRLPSQGYFFFWFFPLFFPSPSLLGPNTNKNKTSAIKASMSTNNRSSHLLSFPQPSFSPYSNDRLPQKHKRIHFPMLIFLFFFLAFFPRSIIIFWGTTHSIPLMSICLKERTEKKVQVWWEKPIVLLNTTHTRIYSLFVCKLHTCLPAYRMNQIGWCWTWHCCIHSPSCIYDLHQPVQTKLQKSTIVIPQEHRRPREKKGTVHKC